MHGVRTEEMASWTFTEIKFDSLHSNGESKSFDPDDQNRSRGSIAFFWPLPLLFKILLQR